MATESDLYQALDKAHQAGDAAAAKDFAAMILHKEYDAPLQPKPVEQPTDKTPEPAPSALSTGQNNLQVYNPFGKNLDTHIPLPASTDDQLAGVGSAFHDIGQGVAQHTGFASTQDVQNTRDTDKELMSTANGRIGNILGNSVAFAPAAAAASVPAAMITGGALGSIQPHTTGSEQLMNTSLGTLAPALGEPIANAWHMAGKIPGMDKLGNLISSVLPGGSTRAARRIFGEAADDTGQGDTSAARAAIEQAGQSGALAGKYNIKPTTAQVAQSPGIASLDRTIRNEPRPVSAGFGERDRGNMNAVDNILTGISGTPQERLRAQAARDFKARTMYDDALHNPEFYVQPPKPSDPSFNPLGGPSGTSGGTPQVGGYFDAELRAQRAATQPTGMLPEELPHLPAENTAERLQKILGRPQVKEAMSAASRMAAMNGETLDERNLIQQMHWAKMHLDDQISSARAAGRDGEMRATMGAKHEFLSVMDDLSPAYADARKSFQAASRPLNRIDVGEALRQKYSPGLGDMGSSSRNPATFANALRNGDDLAKTATGFNGATLANTLNPEDIMALQAAGTQLGRQSFAQNAERAVGSNTAQNLANRSNVNEVGSLHSILPAEGAGAAGVALALHHPALIPISFAGAVTRAATKRKIADALLNPEMAAELLRPKESLMSTYGIKPGMGVALESAANASDNDPQGYAEGGEVLSLMGKLAAKYAPEAADASKVASITPVADLGAARDSKQLQDFATDFQQRSQDRAQKNRELVQSWVDQGVFKHQPGTRLLTPRGRVMKIDGYSLSGKPSDPQPSYAYTIGDPESEGWEQGTAVANRITDDYKPMTGPAGVPKDPAMADGGAVKPNFWHLVQAAQET